MNWHKVWLVLAREYRLNFRRPSFLFTAFGVPLISLASMFLITRFTVNLETNLDEFQTVGYIDRAQIVDLAATPDSDYTPVSDPALAPPGPDADAATLSAYFDALEESAQQQVLDGTLDAYFVVANHYIFSGQVALYADNNIPLQLRDNVEAFLSAQVAHRAPGDLPVPVARLTDSTYTLRDLDSGDEMSEAALMGRIMLPFIFVMLYFMATSTTAQFLMSGVVEEKENRLMEILATSIRPLELLWGKLLGLGVLALTQIAIWVVGGVLIALINEDARDFVLGTSFAATDILLLAGLFLINFLLFSSVLLSIGASVTAETESRQFAGFFTFLSVLPIMFLVVYFNNPHGPLPVILSFVPFTAASSLILRMGVGGLPLWQLWASVGIQVISVFVVMWLGAKVFRLGMLMYGKRLTPRTLIDALRQGQTTLTSAAGEAAPVTRKRRKGWFGR